MKRTFTVALLVLAVSVFVGSAFKVQAATSASPAASVTESTGAGSTDVGYWAAWSEAASH